MDVVEAVVIFRLRNVMFVAPAPVPAVINAIPLGLVVDVLLNVRLRSVPPALLPSMVMKSAPLIRNIVPLATAPLMVGVIPVAGRIVRVLVLLADELAFKMSAAVPISYVPSVRLNTTGPHIERVLYAEMASPKVVKLPPTPTVYVPVKPVCTLFRANASLPGMASAPPFGLLVDAVMLYTVDTTAVNVPKVTVVD